jgi:hypothetical protein
MTTRLIVLLICVCYIATATAEPKLIYQQPVMWKHVQRVVLDVKSVGGIGTIQMSVSYNTTDENGNIIQRNKILVVNLSDIQMNELRNVLQVNIINLINQQEGT